MWFMALLGGGQKPLASGATGPRGLPMGAPLSIMGQPVQGAVTSTGALPQPNMPTPPTGEANLIPPPGGQTPPPGSIYPPGYDPQQTAGAGGYTGVGDNGAPFSGEAQPGQSTFDETQVPKPTEPPKPEGKDEGGFNWLSLLGGEGQKGLAPGSPPKGMQQDSVKRMQINPQTGLIEWV